MIAWHEDFGQPLWTLDFGLRAKPALSYQPAGPPGTDLLGHGGDGRDLLTGVPRSSYVGPENAALAGSLRHLGVSAPDANGPVQHLSER
jgi:hypothetical protein